MSAIRIIKTQNSVYELDVVANHVRRVSGVNPPTLNFEEDGKWHDLASWSRHGNQYLFSFTTRRATLTSAVIE